MCLGCAALPTTLTVGGMLGRHFLPVSPTPDLAPPRPLRPRGFPVSPLALVIVVGIAGLALLGPGSLSYKLDVLGFGVCHQLLSHTFFLGGRPLPVCARCTGIYLGAIVTLGLLAILRPRAGGLPAPGLLPVLGVMFLTMVADGLNSTFQSLPGGQGLWETTNPLRIITGTLAGMALAFLLYPLFNSAFWHRTAATHEPVLERPFELFGFGVAVSVPVGLTLSFASDPGAGWVYWAIALTSIAGLLLLLSLANILLITLVTRRAGVLTSWQAALTPFAIALMLAIIELLLLATVRGSLTSLIGGGLPGDLPLAPGVR